MPKIIKTMELLGYSPGKGGICFGIAMMGSQAIIRDQSQTFIERINFIKNASEEEIKSLVEPFDRKVEKDRLEKKIDLCCFFDELSVYQSNESVNKEFKSIVPDIQSVDNVKKLANAEKDSRYIYPKIKLSVINLFTYNEFIHFILQIQYHLGGCSFSMVISHSPEMHASQLGFDAKQKQWFSSDHDFVVAGKDTIEDIIRVADNIFLPHQYDYDGEYKLVASIDILLPEKDDTNTEEEIDLALPNLLKTHNFNLKKLTKSFNTEALSHLIACYELESRHDEMITIFDKIKSFDLPEKDNVQLLESKRENDFTLFHGLAEKNDPDTLQAIFKKVEEMKLSTQAKIGILDEKDAEHPSLLILALQCGCEKVMPVVVNAINTIEDENTQARLLGAEWSAIPALSIAAERGYTQTVLALTSAMSNIKNEKVKARLLDARDNQNISALLIAADSGRIETVRILINAICNIEDEQLRAKLLEARDDEDIPALLAAVDKGRIEIVAMLIKAICEIEDEQRRAKLLEAKSIKDTSALLRAAEKGHKEIVEMLIKATRSIEDIKVKVSLLEAKRSDGMSASLMATNKGHDEISQILVNAICDIEKHEK